MTSGSSRNIWLVVIFGTLVVVAGGCEEAGDEEPEREITCVVDQPYPYADVTYVSNHVGPANADYVPCEGPVAFEGSWHVLQTHMAAQPNTFAPDGRTTYVTTSPGNDGCTVHALSTWSGKARWERCDLTYAVAASAPEVDEDGTVYVTDRNVMHALDPTDGRSLWTTELPDEAEPGLVYGLKLTGDGHIATQTGNGTVYLVARETGEILVDLDVAAETGFVAPAPRDLGDELLPDFVLARIGILLGYDDPDVAAEAVSGLFGGSGAFADNTVAVTPRGQVLTVGGGPTPETGAVVALDIGGDATAPTLSLAWATELPGGSASSVAAYDAGRRAVLTDGDGTVHAIDLEACDDNTDVDSEPTRCATAWSFVQPGNVLGSLTVAPGGDIYVISTVVQGGEALYALHDAGDHPEVRWTRTYEPNEMFTTVLTATDNVVYGLLTDIDPMFTIEGMAIPIPARPVSSRAVAIDPATGDLLWSVAAPSSSITELIPSPHGDLFLTMAGMVECVVMDPNAPDPVAGLMRFTPVTD